MRDEPWMSLLYLSIAVTLFGNVWKPFIVLGAALGIVGAVGEWLSTR